MMMSAKTLSKHDKSYIPELRIRIGFDNFKEAWDKLQLLKK